MRPSFSCGHLANRWWHKCAKILVDWRHSRSATALKLIEPDIWYGFSDRSYWQTAIIFQMKKIWFCLIFSSSSRQPAEDCLCSLQTTIMISEPETKTTFSRWIKLCSLFSHFAKESDILLKQGCRVTAKTVAQTLGRSEPVVHHHVFKRLIILWILTICTRSWSPQLQLLQGKRKLNSFPALNELNTIGAESSNALMMITDYHSFGKFLQSSF